MCSEIHDLNEWKEGIIFICVICANILSKIRKIEIKFNEGNRITNRLGLFYHLRGIKK